MSFLRGLGAWVPGGFGGRRRTFPVRASYLAEELGITLSQLGASYAGDHLEVDLSTGETVFSGRVLIDARSPRAKVAKRIARAEERDSRTF